jgi:predicted enzyme related to lactoylglutathione lyase
MEKVMITLLYAKETRAKLGRAVVERLTRAGGSVIRLVEEPDYFNAVMADPEGNEFSVG